MPLFFRLALPWCLVRLSTFSYTCLPFLSFLILIELLILLFYCFLLSFKSYLYIVDINPLSNRWFANIFSHFINCLLTLLLVFFTVPKFLFDTISIIYFCFCSLCFWCHIQKKVVAKTNVMFSSKSFSVSCLSI